jgi:hypothetical protein
MANIAGASPEQFKGMMQVSFDVLDTRFVFADLA